MLSFSVVTFIAFLPIFNSNEIIISYGLHPFNICQKNPDFWNFIKYSFIFLSCCTNSIFGNILFNFINKIILSSHVSKKEFKIDEYGELLLDNVVLRNEFKRKLKTIHIQL